MKRLRGGESGQSLTLVLVIIVVFSLLATALLGLASTAALLQKTLGGIERSRAAGDQGVEYGIDQVIEGGASSSFGTSASLSFPGTIDGDVVSVTVKNVSVTSVVITCQVVRTPPTPNDPPQTPCPAITVSAGTPVFLTATVLSGTGNPIAFAPNWNVSPATGFTLSTSACPASSTGVCFVGASPGTYTIRIDVNNVSATAAVTVQ